MTEGARTPLRVRARAPLAGDVARVELEAPERFLDAYRRAGQYVWLRPEGAAAEGPFAFATAPHERAAVFFVRAGEPPSAELAALAPGAIVHASAPAGLGFALERARGHDVVFVATGTGIAPVRAALETVLRTRHAYGALALVHGVRARDALLVEGEHARWRAAGVAVRWASSRTPDPDAVAGWAQHALDLAPPDWPRTAVVAAGQPALLEALRERLVRGGGDARLVLDNLDTLGAGDHAAAGPERGRETG